MSSLALYRRYRPESFAEVIGQEHVTDPLQQALRNNRVNHAYLFSGPRGCGKTTSARILARCLNCEQGPTPTPCGECQSCKDLARNGPGSIDVIEIDAASHGGVDDARDLREKAFFGPASSRYKIYIIDEAHMVTPAGFNALLKVVEEPPEHLKFIFATTEPEKVIGTIRSRTHHYPFRLVPPGTLRSYLADVCGRENSAVADGVLPLVVRAGAGSVRDSMSVMDQLLAGAGDDGVTYAMATALLGYTDGSLLDSIIDAFAAGDGAAAFEVVDRVIEGGNDPRRFVADLLERLRDLVILAAVPDAGEKGLIDAPADVVERMQAQASVFGAAELSRAADLVNDGLTEMRGATSPRLQVELICARVLLPAAFDDERSMQARLDRLERGASAAAAASFAAPPAAAVPMGYVPGPEAHAPQGHAPQAAPVGPDAARAAVRGEAPAPASAAEPVAAQPSAPQPPAEAPAQRPGSWPTAAGGEQARRPGGWPTASAPGSGPATPAPAASSAPAAPAAGGQGMAQGAGQVRNMWPDILEAVKNKRRFTWILLSQNAQVTGFDGTTLQIGFINAGARDNFAGSGSEEVLKQALAERFNAQWRVEAVVDTSGGGAAPPSPVGGRPAPQYTPAPAPSPTAPAPMAYEGTPAHAPQQPNQQYSQQPNQQPNQQQSQQTAAPSSSAQQQSPQSHQTQQGRGTAPSAPEPSHGGYAVAPEDDTAEADDPDLVDSALSGHELIVRELGATVVEEFTNEQ
ncbi:DNA polymerase III subunit gamma and tau [Streptomyces cyaneofuscatus]|uniref:DNA polymerase III subunit gamma and tau n=1 Tax=Streptomyces cyaneofuscatus TaxID=66883 RepID=UPI0033B36435